MAPNVNMILVRGPMGQDRAAFAVPADAFAWVEAQGRPPVIYVRPDGATALAAHFLNQGELLIWALQNGSTR